MLCAGFDCSLQWNRYLFCVGKRCIVCVADLGITADHFRLCLLQNLILRQLGLGLGHGLSQGVEQCGANVACHFHRFACTRNQLPGQRCHCGFAVGAGDGQHLGCVAKSGFQVLQACCKQAQLTALPQAHGFGRIQHRGHHLRAQAGASKDSSHRSAFDQSRGKRPRNKTHIRPFGLQSQQLGWRVTGIGHGDAGPGMRAPTGHCQARSTQTKNQNVLTLKLHGLPQLQG